MGVQDRDWYQDAQAKREQGDFVGYHLGRSRPDSVQSLSHLRVRPSWWPWAVLFGRWAMWALFAFVWLRIIFKYFLS